MFNTVLKQMKPAMKTSLHFAVKAKTHVLLNACGCSTNRRLIILDKNTDYIFAHMLCFFVIQIISAENINGLMKMACIDNYLPYPSDEGRYCFHRCLLTFRGGGFPIRLSREVPPSFPIGEGGSIQSFPMGVPPSQVRMEGYPQLEQHNMYLLRGGQYASCVHAGGFSCLLSNFCWSLSISSDVVFLYKTSLKLT